MTARAAIEVHAGLIPGQPIDAFTRHWWITGEEWAQASAQAEETIKNDVSWNYSGVLPTATLLLARQGEANAYAAYLMLQPDLVNWVKTEWVWF